MSHTQNPTVPEKPFRRRVRADPWDEIEHAPSLGARDLVDLEPPSDVVWPGDAGGAELIAEIEGGAGLLHWGRLMLWQCSDWRTEYERIERKDR